MHRWNYVLVCAAFATTLAAIPALADDAADALKKCDTLASHPSDPDRRAPGVTDDQLVPFTAIEACEAAQKLAPDNARVRFELGRRDTEAFKAFAEAANRGYAPAMKFLGDAYLNGRGLPDGQTALRWYQKSAAGHFSDADDMVDKLQAKIAELDARDKRNQFDASIFQNQDFMSRLYRNDASILEEKYFIIYLQGFIDKIGGTEPFFCKRSIMYSSNKGDNYERYISNNS